MTVTVSHLASDGIVLSGAGVSACTFTAATIPAGYTGIVDGTLTCPFADASAGTPFDILATDVGGTNPYPIDFKVNGVTVPELSGEFEPVTGTTGGLTATQRNFLFTNDGATGNVVEAAVDPPTAEALFTLTVVPPGTTDDTLALTILDEPTVGTDTSCVLASPAVTCAYGTGAFAFNLQVTVVDATPMGLDGYDVDVSIGGTTVKIVAVAADMTVPAGTIINVPIIVVYPGPGVAPLLTVGA